MPFHSIRKFSLTPITFLIVAFFFSFTSQAQPFFIDDSADVISKEMESKLTPELLEAEKGENFHIQAVILPHFYGKPADKVVAAYYQHMIQNTTATRAALLLIVLDKEFVQIVTTPNMVDVFNANVMKDITTQVKTQMQAKKYDEMLRVGVSGILHYFREKLTTESKRQSTSDILNFIVFLGMVGLVIYLVKQRIPKKSD